MIRIKLLALLALFISLSPSASELNKVERIVALSPHSVELLFSIGVGDRIVGATEFADYPEAAKKIPRVGGYHGVSIERIIELNPDLIVVWKSGNSDADIERLKKLGFNLYESHPQKLDQVGAELLKLGELVGEPEAGRQKSDQFYRRLNQLRSSYAGREPVSVFYQLWPKPLRAMAAGSWINEVISGCGGVNVLDASYPDYPEVSLESIVLKKPQVILMPSQHGADESTNVNWQQWPEIPAVANGHIYQLNGDILHRFTLRILDGMQAVCTKLELARTAKKSVE